MNIILIPAGVVLIVAGLVVLPLVAYVMLETHPPRSLRRLILSLGAITVNFATMAGGVGLIWLALK